MRAVDIIVKKREGGELSRAEIEFFVNGFTKGEIPDYQVSAWAMAVYFMGMTERETADLTLAMAHSGEVLDLSSVVPIAVDKHSTGGVGDKTTLVVEPIVAACGVPVGKMSGRGLGFSGGTIDKMEAIPGFRTNLNTQEFLTQLKSIGLVLTAQAADLAPADGILYALRDVTGTIQSIPLIISSVMSKKIAAGAQAIVLDVKVGVGAFMTDLEQATVLAKGMVVIARLSGRKAIAILSDMNQPLGVAIGNALELVEAIQILKLEDNIPQDFLEHCIIVASHMLVLTGAVKDVEKGRVMAYEALESGRAWQKFHSLVAVQGGDVSFIENTERLPAAHFIENIPAPVNAFIKEINARKIGETAVLLGAGRKHKKDIIDHSVGLKVYHKVGDQIKAGEPLMTIYANSEERLAEACQYALSAFGWSKEPVERLPMVYGIVHE